MRLKPEQHEVKNRALDRKRLGDRSTMKDGNGHRTASTLSHLEGSLSGATYFADELINVDPIDGRPLLARYERGKAADTSTDAGPRPAPARPPPSAGPLRSREGRRHPHGRVAGPPAGGRHVALGRAVAGAGAE